MAPFRIGILICLLFCSCSGDSSPTEQNIPNPSGYNFIEVDGDPRYFVNVAVNGMNFICLYDTGAVGFWVNQSVATLLQLTPEDMVQSAPHFGNYTHDIYYYTAFVQVEGQDENVVRVHGVVMQQDCLLGI